MRYKQLTVLCLAADLVLTPGCGKDDDGDSASSRRDYGPQGRAWLETVLGNTVPTYVGEPIELKVKYLPGHYRFDQQTTVEASGLANGTPQTMTMAMGYTGDVDISEDIARGEQTVAVTIGGISMRMDMPGMPRMTYDNNSPSPNDNPEIARAMGPMVGWTGTVCYRGDEFVRVEGTDDLMARLGATPEGRQTAMQMEEMMKTFLTQRWDGGMPARPVSPGDTWEESIQLEGVPMMGDVTMVCYGGLRDVINTPDGQVALVSMAMELNMGQFLGDLADSMGVSGADVDFSDFVFYINADMEFNTALGLATRTTMTMFGGGDMTFAARGRTESVSMDLSMEQVMVVTPR